ncbi:Nucleolar protein NOP5 [Reticulomyxa filosa]|uniref:Nucleolar protein NOP5 n=1 Tax=Reticulomyxa filosa TaxID=46433 RepID=X6MD06_RETFI|nr:Nucleolar protein NOP5 [Reticulomyxa filosa]|eukprot:ETO11779.1 Nucleolar protein NOP5 [Reticulomyxa filosa]
MMVGELVGARLLAHAGSLVNLAKYPASTVQILGAEKALFRALKQSTDTPKYGLIYHAAFVTAASQPNKARIARSLACKTALATRIDAFTTIARAGERPDEMKNDKEETEVLDEETWQKQSQMHAGSFLGKLQSRIDKLEQRKTIKKNKKGDFSFFIFLTANGKNNYCFVCDFLFLILKKTSKKRKREEMEDDQKIKEEDSISGPPTKKKRTQEPVEEAASKSKKKSKKEKEEAEASEQPPAQEEQVQTEEITEEAPKKKKQKKKKTEQQE